MPHHGSITRVITNIAILTIMLGVVSTLALAERVATFSVKLDGGSSDLGNGTHEFGHPRNSGEIRIDYTPNALGNLVCTARVLGTLYYDDFFSRGNARLDITYKDRARNTLATQTVTINNAPGSNANLAENKVAVDRQFQHTNLSFVEVRAGSASREVAAPLQTRVFRVFNGGAADLGSGFHLNTRPGSALVQFDRVNGSMQGQVVGTLYWDDPNLGGTARAIIEYRSVTNTVLSSQTFNVTGPGRDANLGANQTPVNSAFRPSSGLLRTIRVRLGQVVNNAFSQTLDNTIDFHGSVTGFFDLAPSDVSVRTNEKLNYAFTWTVPAPLNWHDLQFLELRIRDGADVIISVRFDEASNTFSLFNEATGRFSEGVAPGSNERLETEQARLYLAETTVVGSGPTGPSVTLNLPLSFKSRAAGHTFVVEVAATNDLGDRDDFFEAGTVTVTRDHDDHHGDDHGDDRGDDHVGGQGDDHGDDHHDRDDHGDNRDKDDHGDDHRDDHP